MPDLRDDALRVVVLKRISDRVSVTYEHARVMLFNQLLEARRSQGLKSVNALLPGSESPVATMTLTQPSDAAQIDDKKLLAWVQQEHPDEIVTIVRPSFLAALRSRLKIHDGLVWDRHTGEEVAWATVVKAGEPKSFSLTGLDANAIETAWRDGRINPLDYVELPALEQR